jgi:hypothetical protein
MIKAKTFSTITLFAMMFFIPAHARALPAEAVAPTQFQLETIQQLLGDRLTRSDIERLLEHIKSSASIPSDLKRRLRAGVSDLRLEYGFQMAVLLARWKRAVPQLGEVDLDELFQRLERALDD